MTRTAPAAGRGDALRLISLHSYKGGVGKTTMSYLLGRALAEGGRKVCLVDLDLMAPGLDQLVGGGPASAPALARDEAIQDHLFADPKEPGRIPDLSKLPRDTGLTNLTVAPGRPGYAAGRDACGYVLADARAGLLRARLESALKGLAAILGDPVFILDCPPSLFGAAAAARRLVGDKGGASVHVAAPIRQDLRGLLSLADDPEGSACYDWKRGTDAGTWLVLNMSAQPTRWQPAPLEVAAEVAEAFGMSDAERVPLATTLSPFHWMRVHADGALRLLGTGLPLSGEAAEEYRVALSAMAAEIVDYLDGPA